MSPTANPFRSLFGALMFTGMMLVIVAGLKSYRDLSVAQERQGSLERRVEASHVRVEALRSRVDLLRNDPAMLERLAREQRGLVLPDDLVLVLPAAESD
jgi:cell division protein FtsB